MIKSNYATDFSTSVDLRAVDQGGEEILSLFIGVNGRIRYRLGDTAPASRNPLYVTVKFSQLLFSCVHATL